MEERTLMSINAHRLMAWFSPSFPTGAFAYSHGLEQAIHDEVIQGGDDLEQWISTILRLGSGWNDAVLLAMSFSGEDVGELAEALAGSRERHKETMDQGAAFAKTASKLLGCQVPPKALPVAVGEAASFAKIPISEVLPLYLHSFSANLVSVGIRLIPIGQTEGQMILQNLFPIIDEVASKAIDADLDALGSSAFLSDIASMKHEDMKTRIFRT